MWKQTIVSHGNYRSSNNCLPNCHEAATLVMSTRTVGLRVGQALSEMELNNAKYVFIA